MRPNTLERTKLGTSRAPALALSRDLNVSYKCDSFLAQTPRGDGAELRGRVIGGEGKVAEVIGIFRRLRPAGELRRAPRIAATPKTNRQAQGGHRDP